MVEGFDDDELQGIRPSCSHQRMMATRTAATATDTTSAG